MKNEVKTWIALGAGLAIGSLLGVLFAPDKGNATRKKIAEKSKKMKEELTEKMHLSKNSIKKDYQPERVEMEEFV